MLQHRSVRQANFFCGVLASIQKREGKGVFFCSLERVFKILKSNKKGERWVVFAKFEYAFSGR